MVAFRQLTETSPNLSDPEFAPAGLLAEEVVANDESQPLSEYLLVCEAIPASDTVGTWRFSLETAAGESLLDIQEKEFGDPKRLALLAMVRGLEAIEGAASVTLIATSRYVIRGLRDSLHRWRENGFMWEHFGRMIEVENADLWRRVDRALQFHQVHACLVSATKVSGYEATTDRAPAANDSLPVSRSRRPLVPPADRLRRWLLSQSGSSNHPKRRYGPADLALA
ncbi:Ribonuclease HI [Roseimaritima multifibrata]|uniref:Ribonuclease HI n=1 Tax=Roseimaritima multifibrata TaxID=1930274 RepID=A0A517MCS0_9BACT|nr:RNase H family protein [Roseimaritima multifibrata]QDS92688.1 Ribonuclease HI [Roseimaritima multifibrata]